MNDDPITMCVGGHNTYSDNMISVYIRDISYLLFIIMIYIHNCKMKDISLINE